MMCRQRTHRAHRSATTPQRTPFLVSRHPSLTASCVCAIHGVSKNSACAQCVPLSDHGAQPTFAAREFDDCSSTNWMPLRARCSVPAFKRAGPSLHSKTSEVQAVVRAPFPRRAAAGRTRRRARRGLPIHRNTGTGGRSCPRTPQCAAKEATDPGRRSQSIVFAPVRTARHRARHETGYWIAATSVTSPFHSSTFL